MLALSFVLFATGLAQPLGHFFQEGPNGTQQWPLNPQSAWLDGMVHYRLLPGHFPEGMNYHFDGLASVMMFRFTDNQLTLRTTPFKSNAEIDYNKCFFFGSGTTHAGTKLCFKNPAVNLLPIEGQLWLTIDTFAWGRVDPLTLLTLPTHTNVSELTLNAHPTCDPVSGECFVQHPCPASKDPISRESCFSRLKPGPDDLQTVELSRTDTKSDKILQHSHSPCITPNYLVSKLDHFAPGAPTGPGGLLGYLHQKEDNEWLVMDRRTNVSRLMKSDFFFVNNHFWNCYEKNGNVVVDTVTATEDYLDNYYRATLTQPSTNWTKLFHRPQRCLVPFNGTRITCTPLLQDTDLFFDYPTFNQLFKMNPDYKFYYGIAPHTTADHADRWFTRIIKVDQASGVVVAEWSEDNVYVTEADFIPKSLAGGAEDAGLLVSIAFNATSSQSSLLLLDASTMKLVDRYPLASVIPFHAHGIHCRSPAEGGKCFPNP